jgi:hypothetical protein
MTTRTPLHDLKHNCNQLFLFIVQVSTLGYKTNHNISKKRGRIKSLPENNNKDNQKPNREIDPFSNFLFGNSKHRETYKESENNSPENSDTTSQNQLEHQIENLLKNVDVEKLTENINLLVDTAKQFKPLIKEITPFYNQIIKKIKSK